MLLSCNSSKGTAAQSVSTDSMASVRADSTSHIATTDARASHRSVDTIIIRDSVSHVERGDTVYVSRYKYVYRYVQRQDTIAQHSALAEYKQSTDTLTAAKTEYVRIPVEVEKKLTAWQKTRMAMGDVLIIALLIGLCAAVVWLAKKYRK